MDILNYLCPYCFESHRMSTVQFRCTNPRCTREDDVPLTKYAGGDMAYPLQALPVFQGESKIPLRMPSKATCPHCQQTSHKRICPSCHNELPDEIDRINRNVIISVVGARDTGKSHYIGVLIEELRMRILPAFSASLTPLNETVIETYKTRYYNNLYVEQVRLPQSTSGLVGVRQLPLVYTATFGTRDRFGRKSNQSYSFVFFDTAGEDLNNLDTMTTVNRYICKSAGIIVLLDPFQIRNVRMNLPDEVVQRASSIPASDAARPAEILGRISQLVRRDRGLSNDDKINIPIAAAFSKYDAIQPLIQAAIPSGAAVNEPSAHCSQQRFDTTDWANVHHEINSLLASWDATDFIAQLERNYSKFSFFAFSALGNNPRRDGHFDRPRPHRIEDPLLWLLHHHKVVR